MYPLQVVFIGSDILLTVGLQFIYCILIGKFISYFIRIEIAYVFEINRLSGFWLYSGIMLVVFFIAYPTMLTVILVYTEISSYE